MNDTLDDPTGPPPTDPLPPPPPPPAATAPIIGGVCATLADRLGVEAVWIRIGFVILGVSSGVGLFAYLGLWLALVIGRERRSRGLVALGTVVILLTMLGAVPLTVTVPSLLGGTVFSPLGLPLVVLLAGVALALWQPRTARPASGWNWSPPSGETWARGTTGTDSTGSGWASSGSVPPATPVPDPPPPSILGPLTLGAAFVVVAFGALIDQLNGGRLHPEQWLGAGAVVCGIGLLVGTVRGRARWLILPALALASMGFLAGHMARMDIPAGDATGERHLVPDLTPGAPPVEGRVGLGSIVVQADMVPTVDDLPALSPIDARVGIGTIEVWVPDGMSVEIRPRSSTPVSGYEVRQVGDVYRVGPDGPPDLVVHAWVGVGRIRVQNSWRAPQEWAPDMDPPASDVVDLASLTFITDGVAMTDDGVFVLGDGEAVIDADDEILVGDSWLEGDNVTMIPTTWGDFRLLPRSLLTTPHGEVLDLQALRAAHATTATTTDTTSPSTTGDDAEAIPTDDTEEEG